MQAPPSKYRILRHFVLSLTLLCAFLPGNLAAFAQVAPAPVHAVLTQKTAVQSAETDPSSRLGEETGLFAIEATPISRLIALQPANPYPGSHLFRHPEDEKIPPYAARAPGINFLDKFFPTSILPNAP